MPLCSRDFSFRSRSKSTTISLSESHTKAIYFTEASTNTVLQLTGYDTLADIHVLDRVAGSLIEIARLRHAKSGLFAMADQLDARVC